MTETQLRTYLKGRFRGYQDTLTADADLSDVVDSLGLFELAEFVEGASGIRIPASEFRPARFASIREILIFVEELRERQSVSAR
ncbi:MAG TPA: acyl carrier protein [Longimicrobiales bacterium]|nr:acyl carrier protein [Longimicrobiales bacterium]